MPFERQELNLPSGKLSYFVAGSGAPLLYLHPAGGFSVSKPLEALSERYKIFAPVTPGFDGTAPNQDIASMEQLADLAARFAEHVIGKRCDVIGQSFGGWEALWLAVKHPGTIDHLVLEAPAGVPAGGKGGLPGNRRMLDHYGAASLSDAVLPARVAAIAAPTLILMGTKDEIIPPETGRF